MKICVCVNKWVESDRMYVEKVKRKKDICLMVCLFSNAFQLKSFVRKQKYFSKMIPFFHIATSISPDEDPYLIKKLSIIIISYTKIILIKYFCINTKDWSLNTLANKPTTKHIFLRFYLFYVHYIYIYIYIYLRCECMGHSMCFEWLPESEGFLSSTSFKQRQNVKSFLWVNYLWVVFAQKMDKELSPHEPTRREVRGSED